MRLYFTLLGRDLGGLILQMFSTWSSGLYKLYGILCPWLKLLTLLSFISFLSWKVNYGSLFHNYRTETASRVGEFLLLLLLRLFHRGACVIGKWNVSEEGLRNQRCSSSTASLQKVRKICLHSAAAATRKNLFSLCFCWCFLNLVSQFIWISYDKFNQTSS